VATAVAEGSGPAHLSPRTLDEYIEDLEERGQTAEHQAEVAAALQAEVEAGLIKVGQVAAAAAAAGASRADEVTEQQRSRVRNWLSTCGDLHDTFTRLDVNEDGFVSKTELSALSRTG
jgi:hypothetical protein